jgi:hypothetical protein
MSEGYQVLVDGEPPKPFDADIQRRIADATAEALWQELRLTLNESQRRVPVDTGYLRGSGYVAEPVALGDRVIGSVGYSAEYAYAVHEIPPYYIATREKRRGAHHSSGTWKFLEKVILERSPKFEKRIAMRVKNILRGEK